MTESGFALGKREMACSFGSCSVAEQTAEKRDPPVRHSDLVIDDVGYGKNANSRRGTCASPRLTFSRNLA